MLFKRLNNSKKVKKISKKNSQKKSKVFLIKRCYRTFPENHKDRQLEADPKRPHQGIFSNIRSALMWPWFVDWQNFSDEYFWKLSKFSIDNHAFHIKKLKIYNDFLNYFTLSCQMTQAPILNRKLRHILLKQNFH